MEQVKGTLSGWFSGWSGWTKKMDKTEPPAELNAEIKKSPSAVKFEVDIEMIRADVNRKLGMAAEELRAEKVERPFKTLTYLYLCLKIDEQLDRIQNNQGWLHTKLNQTIPQPQVSAGQIQEKQSEPVLPPLTT